MDDSFQDPSSSTDKKATRVLLTPDLKNIHVEKIEGKINPMRT